MADEQQEESSSEEQQQEQDPIKNLKAEMARKHANFEQQQQETKSQLDAILAEVQKAMKPADDKPKKSARELVFDDPEEFVRQVKAEAISEASETVTRQYQASQAVQNTVASIQALYPEFAQEGSEAVILATKKAANLPAYMKGKPEGVRLAMQEAAAELGLVQASKRKTVVVDEPVIGRGSGSQQSGGGSKSKGKVDEKTRQFAELLGMDLSDPKQLANLEQASTRKNWSKYE